MIYNLTESLRELGFSHDIKARTYFGCYKDFPIVVTYKKLPGKNTRTYDIHFMTSLSKKERKLTIKDLPHLEGYEKSKIFGHIQDFRIVKLSYSGAVRKRVIKDLLRDFDESLEHFRKIQAFPVCSQSGQTADLGFYWVKNKPCIMSEQSFKGFLKEAEDYRFEQDQKRERTLLGFLASLIISFAAVYIRMTTRFEQYPALFFLFPSSILINWLYIKLSGLFRPRSQWIPKYLTFITSVIVATTDLLQSKGLSWNGANLIKLVGKIEVVDFIIFLTWIFLGVIFGDWVQSYYSSHYDKNALARPLVNHLVVSTKINKK